jgi:acyl carrier protein
MSAMADQIRQILYQCIEELNEQRSVDQQLAKSPDTDLFGDSGRLDSLGFVNFIALVEDKCESRFRVALSITEDAAKDEGGRPFETVGQLADFIEQLLVVNKIIGG